MDCVSLGKTGINVSRLGLGTLTMGPLQAGMAVDDGARVIACAVREGINFFDTAELYETYPYIKRALSISGFPDVIIASKTYAYTAAGAKKAVEDAKTALERDYIDIFMLHEQESIHTLRGHMEALDELYRQKSLGAVRAVGVSTHHVAGADAAITLGVDVLHPLINRAGIGIADGTREDMERAVKRAHENGVGVVAMKALGGGHLFSSAGESLRYALSNEDIDCVMIGMQSEEEVLANVGFYKSGQFDEEAQNRLNKNRRLMIHDWCTGCGQCVKACMYGALTVTGGKAWCDRKSCVLCGYCGARCPDVCIKVI